jgi:hypothetical protein
MRAQRRHDDGRPIEAVEREVRDKLRENRMQRWMAVLMVPCGLLLLVTIGTNPIPRGQTDGVREYLSEHFPNAPVDPRKTSAAAVAALFHVIRTAPDDVAAPAIEFAAEQRLGYASPYGIERLETSTDTRLRAAARDYLIAIAQWDYGDDPQASRWWWRNPPQNVWGVRIGQTTTELSLLVLGVLAPLNLWGVYRWLRKEPPESFAGCLTAGLGFGWFFGFILAGLRLVGGLEQCTFGSQTIRYHTNHGTVLGLEDARAGGGELFVLLLVVWLAVPFLAALVLAGWAVQTTRNENARKNAAARALLLGYLEKPEGRLTARRIDEE